MPPICAGSVPQRALGRSLAQISKSEFFQRQLHRQLALLHKTRLIRLALPNAFVQPKRIYSAPTIIFKFCSLSWWQYFTSIHINSQISTAQKLSTGGCSGSPRLAATDWALELRCHKGEIWNRSAGNYCTEAEQVDEWVNTQTLDKLQRTWFTNSTICRIDPNWSKLCNIVAADWSVIECSNFQFIVFCILLRVCACSLRKAPTLSSTLATPAAVISMVWLPHWFYNVYTKKMRHNARCCTVTVVLPGKPGAVESSANPGIGVKIVSQMEHLSWYSMI